jgi:ribonuclease P protein subunit RPR2
MAGREAAVRPERSRRYAQLASRIAMRYNIRIPPVQKRKICGGCGMFLVPGVSCTVRISAGRKVVTCLSCKTARRFVVGRRVAL